MKNQCSETIEKCEIRNQIQRIREGFDMPAEDIKKHPQLRKIHKYLESKDAKEKYAIENYVVYKPEYDVSAK